ncbi:MAG: RidA family protein [Propionibacteriaceae bacterium]|jgi:enamine deaminase RidA (YjgF/YER057c/UK114 family)|nr:RidA family protein [Propionibacteriaceae bacterium]
MNEELTEPLPSTRLAELGIELPPVAKPVAAYVPALISSGQVVTSGQLPFVDGTLLATGKVGAQVSPEQAQELARVAALNGIAAAAAVAGGVDGLQRVVKVTVFVASDPSFTGQPQVANGASQLLLDVFGPAGVHARSAVGVAVLPLDSPLELELTFEANAASF